MKVNKIDEHFQISSSSLVRLKEAGNVFEVLYSQSRSQGGYITKIDKDHYVDNRTGEYLEFKHLENRSQDLSNVAKSLAQGRDLLNTNILDVSCCRWITLTYAENMTDSNKLRKDFEHFNKRCRELFGHYEYITAAEPQGRGAWHLHVVLIFSGKAPYMANDIVRDCWKQGFVTVKRLDDVDNVGAYLTAYLGDMELSEASELDSIHCVGFKNVDFVDENGEKQTKHYLKGARLVLYPPGFHIFRWSKGIKKPAVSLTSYEQAREKIGSAKLTFSKTVLLEDSETDFKNTLQYEYYNTIRK